MPLQAQQADNEHTRLLIAEYERLELVLLEEVAKRLRKNQSALDWVTQRLNEITALKQAAAAHIAAMVNGHPRVLDDAIEKAARDGVAVANRDIAAVGRDTGGGGMLLNTAGSALATNSRAIALLHHEASFALNTLNTGILRATEDMYRKVVAQTVPTVISGVETRVQSTQRALDEYAKHGIKGFTDKGGRTWSMTAYAEMATRTAATRALTQSHQDRLMERGYDLVVISSHPRPAPQCQPYERQVLSLSGMNSGNVEVENALTGRKTSVRVKASLETATGRGLFHPNCRHTSQLWVPGVTDTTPTEPNDEGYEDTQKLRYLERQTRDWKRRSATALTPDAKRRADAKVKEWQKKIREHIDESGVGRRRDREQITGVYGPGNATRADASTTNAPRTTEPQIVTPNATRTDVPTPLKTRLRHPKKQIQATTAPEVSTASRERIEAELEALPARSRELLEENGVKLFVGTNVQTAARLDPTIATRYDGFTTGDGRPLTDVSFWSPDVNTVIVSADAAHGSVSVVAHELGHALDYTALKTNPATVVWQEQGNPNLPASLKTSVQQPVSKTISRIADDPYLKWAHDQFVSNSPIVDDYYRTGSMGNAKSGREEWIAEGYAAIVTGKKWKLNVISGQSKQAADLLRWSLTRLGVM